ncbi:transposase, partial [Porphyromonas macacae]
IPQDPMKTSPVPKSDLTLKEREELERLRQENRLLKTKLKRESLGHEAYKLLVELAEETYGIEIRKNSEAK